jgi:hypothetical protein
VVGSHHQRHLHVVLRAAIRGRRGPLAAQPNRVGGLRPALRRTVFRRARRVRRPTGRTAVGGRKLHAGRRRRRPGQPAVHVPRGRGCSRRWAAGRDAHEPARRSSVRGADLHPRLGNAASAVGRGVARLRTGQRQPGGGDSLAARRGDRDDFDVPVATSQAWLAPAAGRLSAGDGVRAGVLRRALRRRHSDRLGPCRGGVGGDGPSRLLVVTPSRCEVSRFDSASGRSWQRPRRRRPGRPGRRRSPCAGWR